MSLETKDRGSLDTGPEMPREAQKGPKITYTREFLLSIGDLEVCKKLPDGFDKSLLGEFDNAPYGIHDRQRSSGSLPLQGYRRTDYSSSPPTRGDSGSYSRTAYGRWDTRSSGRSDRDSDSQSDRDSETGRRYGNQSRRSWQTSEHDGLLGSGSFARTSGYTAGMSGPKVRANDHYQLNKSNEPYHPPRPYKAVPHPHSRREDSFNDETFGSTECTSEDRVEEERRRRASFELMRKEQQKALQEKQKHKPDGVSGLSALLEDTKEDKCLSDSNNDLDAPTAAPVLDNDAGKSSFLSQSPVARPLVPPGFKNNVPERDTGAKPLLSGHTSEVGKPETELNIFPAKVNASENDTLAKSESLSMQEIFSLSPRSEVKNTQAPFPTKSSSSSLNVSQKELGIEDHLYRTLSIPESHKGLDDPEVVEISAAGVGSRDVGEPNKNGSASILDKIFGSALTLDVGRSGSDEPHVSKAEVARSPSTVESSKFAHWFLEEESKPADDVSSGRPNNLLSLIVKEPVNFLAEFSSQTTELNNMIRSKTNGVLEPLKNCNKKKAGPPILTCEDLEQTILSEYTEASSNSRPPMLGLSATRASSGELREHVDDRASHHLLSLLQKGSGLMNLTVNTPGVGNSSGRPLTSEVHEVGTLLDEPRKEDTRNGDNAGKSLTLESLFGTAFMKELKSVEAPVSIQKGAPGASGQIDVMEPYRLSHAVSDDGLYPPLIDDVGANKAGKGNSVFAPNQAQQLNKSGSWLGVHHAQNDMNLSKRQAEVLYNQGGPDRTFEFQLPEEESLIALGNRLSSKGSMHPPARDVDRGEYLSSNAPVGTSSKLATMSSLIQDERPTLGADGLPFPRSPYDQEQEIRYQNLRAQPSSPPLRPHIHGRPLFHPGDSHHMNPQLKFLSPENMIRHDALGNHQYPTNMIRPPFHHPSPGATGFERPVHHPMLHQMQVSGNYPQPLHDFTRGAPVPHLNNQSTGVMPEANPGQGFPFGPHQPNVGGLGMPMPAPNVTNGNNHPEALQRLIEMELRAKSSKQMHPFVGGHSQGTYGHELDTGLRYR